MAKQKNIWKFNEDDWKIHFDDKDLLDKVREEFDLGSSTTVYYEQGVLSKETSWDLVIPNDKINKVKKFIKDNT
jgi:zona occludens toxin (predicted ATPase)|tara:strand:- start:56 stop:277 length:222 start_codon:yes stop_codon:yes gene_type:complete